jgi:hypothetical protein
LDEHAAAACKGREVNGPVISGDSRPDRMKPARYAVPLGPDANVMNEDLDCVDNLSPPEHGPSHVAAPPDLLPTATLPGALMYRRPYPAGLPDPHTMRSAHLHVAAGSSTALAAIPKDERVSLFESLTRTFRRSEYHWLRFLDLAKELPARRAKLPGHVFWDEFVEFLYFEAQAFCGGARTVLDELVYIVARAHGVPAKKARKHPWETSHLMTSPVLAPDLARPEILHLRGSLSWFQHLNAYRNSFYHHGWRHGAGHFDAGEVRSVAADPAANALIVPDAESLAGRAKPSEWTYKRKDRLDRVMDELHEGLDTVLRGLCEGPWSTPEPSPGTKPRVEHPNMIVSLVTPAIYLVHGELAAVAFFTTEEKARALRPGPADVELLQLPAAESVLGQYAVTFSLRGIEQLGLPPAIRTVKALVDPVVTDPEWRNISCTHALDLDLGEVLAKPASPINLVVGGIDHLFAWVSRGQGGWRT